MHAVDFSGRPTGLDFLNQNVASPVKRRADHLRLQRGLDSGGFELLLHRQEMPSLLLREREQGDVSLPEALDFLDGHDDRRAPVDGIGDGDRFQVATRRDRLGAAEQPIEEGIQVLGRELVDGPMVQPADPGRDQALPLNSGRVEYSPA